MCVRERASREKQLGFSKGFSKREKRLSHVASFCPEREREREQTKNGEKKKKQERPSSLSSLNLYFDTREETRLLLFLSLLSLSVRMNSSVSTKMRSSSSSGNLAASKRASAAAPVQQPVFRRRRPLALARQSSGGGAAVVSALGQVRRFVSSSFCFPISSPSDALDRYRALELKWGRTRARIRVARSFVRSLARRTKAVRRGSAELTLRASFPPRFCSPCRIPPH